MLENMKFKRKVLSRKKIITSFLIILILSLCLGGFMYGLADSFEDFADIRILQIGFLVLFPLFTVIMWVPLCLGGGQIYEDRRKWNMILHVLCNDDVTPFLQEIRYEDIDHAKFTVDRKAGVWGLSRYTYLLKLYNEKELFMTLYINPMDNGILLPAGKGGIVLSGFRTSEDILNMMQLLMAGGIRLEDPHHILDAMKRKDIEIYDYLESLQIKRRY